MNLYILYDKELGSQYLYGQKLTCREFQDLVSELAKQYGDDVYILKEVLMDQYGFKKADIQCVHTTKNRRV